jgi:hypothetical protein
MTLPCLLGDYPMEKYKGFPGLNATTVRLAHRFHGEHLLHQLRKKGESSNKTDFKLGSLIHEKWLEPESYESSYSILPGRYEGSDPLSRKKRGAFQSTAKATGRTVIPESLHGRVLEAVDALGQNDEACLLLEACEAESSFFWNDPDWGKCKARLDLIDEKRIIDLKCYHGGRSESDFLRSMERQGLGIQLVWYRRGARVMGREVDRMGHLIYDPETSSVRLRWMTRNELDSAEKNCTLALERIALLRRSQPQAWHRCVSHG